MYATVLPVQYVISAGPEPNRIKIRMMKTSPIDTTAESFGSRRLMVATNTEVIASKKHGSEYSFGAVRHKIAKTMEARHTARTYSRQAYGCSFHCRPVLDIRLSGRQLLLEANRGTQLFWCVPRR